MPTYAIGIDVGGTFTDCYVSDGRRGWRGKAPTTPEALGDGLLAALDVAAADVGMPLAALLADTARFTLGTTAVTNCLAQGNGLRTGLLVTEGFGDLWPMARGHRLGIDGMNHPLPVLVPRRRIGEVPERIDRDGRIVRPLAEDAVASVVDRLVRTEGVQSLAVCLLWSFRNPLHEQRVAAIVAARHPGLHVSCSAELFPVIREYERMTTTVLNAYTARACGAFLDAVEGRLRAAGLRVPIAVMQSAGGTFTPADARAKPILLAQSGPVAGVAGAQAVGGRLGIPDLLTGDMGGTSFDVAVIHGGAPERRTRAELFGLWTGMSTVAVDSIGAGGGSIAWADARGALRVGPRSAGAEPGPACYGRGGTEPTVTDALVVLGLLDPGRFLRGRIVLDGESAFAALARLGRAVGLRPEATACGVYRLAREQMTLAVKTVLVARGLDPRRYAFLSYGGCGALFAAPLARALGIRRVVVPRLAAVFSAFGAATAEPRREAVCTLFRPLPVDVAEMRACCDRLADEARTAMTAAGVPAADVTVVHEADLRFRRQTWEVTVPLARVDADGVGGLAAAFRALYASLYGTGALVAGTPIDLVNCRAIATPAPPAPSDSAPPPPPRTGATPRGARPIWLPGTERMARVPVYDGEALVAGAAFVGPGLVERPDTTILVDERDRVTVEDGGDLSIEVGDA
jgi:N-methylhydantoinase A